MRIVPRKDGETRITFFMKYELRSVNTNAAKWCRAAGSPWTHRTTNKQALFSATTHSVLFQTRRKQLHEEEIPSRIHSSRDERPFAMDFSPSNRHRTAACPFNFKQKPPGISTPEKKAHQHASLLGAVSWRKFCCGPNRPRGPDLNRSTQRSAPSGPNLTKRQSRDSCEPRMLPISLRAARGDICHLHAPR
jgi:hypothetical protein